MKLPELRIGTKIAKVPIVQGGMAIRLSTARLAAAVANEGGIGLIAASGMSHDELRYEIKLARSLTYGIIGINIMVAAREFAGDCQDRPSTKALTSSWPGQASPVICSATARNRARRSSRSSRP